MTGIKDAGERGNGARKSQKQVSSECLSDRSEALGFGSEGNNEAEESLQYMGRKSHGHGERTQLQSPLIPIHFIVTVCKVKHSSNSFRELNSLEHILCYGKGHLLHC